MIQEISTYPRAVRLIEGLGMNLTCDAAIRQKDTGVFINPSNVDPSFAQCFSVKGTVDCDVGFSSLKPLCFLQLNDSYDNPICHLIKFSFCRLLLLYPLGPRLETWFLPVGGLGFSLRPLGFLQIFRSTGSLELWVKPAMTSAQTVASCRRWSRSSGCQGPRG